MNHKIDKGTTQKHLPHLQIRKAKKQFENIHYNNALLRLSMGYFQDNSCK